MYVYSVNLNKMPSTGEEIFLTPEILIEISGELKRGKIRNVPYEDKEMNIGNDWEPLPADSYWRPLPNEGWVVTASYGEGQTREYWVVEKWETDNLHHLAREFVLKEGDFDPFTIVSVEAWP